MREIKADLAVGLKDETSQGVTALQDNLKKALNEVFKAFEEVNKAADGSGKVSKEVLEELGKGLEDLAQAFESSSRKITDINQETFVGLGRTFEELEDTFVKTAKAFPNTFVEGFEEKLNEINTTFETIENFGRSTARDLNKDFNSFFNKGFKTGTFSMGELWKDVLNNMKNNFFDALSAMAARLATSAIFKAFQGGLNVLGF
ncbi:MAG: hypothetical protein ACE5G9_10065, partial [Nitrospinales bacterium]